MRSIDLIDSTTSVPRHEAERLLVVATGLSRSHLLIGFEVSTDQQRSFERLVERRESGEPLQYIEGSVPFGPVEISVDSRVLVPRPETEYLFELVTTSMSNPKVIVDLCTGSGNLAIALKRTYPDAAVYATDVSQAALNVAIDNAKRNGTPIDFCRGDLFEPLPTDVKGEVDLLVSNPPYLAEIELEQVPQDVRNEPSMALVAGQRGDEVVTRIAKEVADWLAPGGRFAIEVSEFHASAMAKHFAHLDAQVVNDLTGRERFVMSSSLVE